MVRGDCNVSKAKESSSRNCQFQNWLISADVTKNYTETLVNCKLCEDYILPRFHFTTQSNDIFVRIFKFLSKMTKCFKTE